MVKLYIIIITIVLIIRLPAEVITDLYCIQVLKKFGFLITIKLNTVIVIGIRFILTIITDGVIGANIPLQNIPKVIIVRSKPKHSTAIAENNRYRQLCIIF